MTEKSFLEYPSIAERKSRLVAMNAHVAGRTICAQCGATAMTEQMRGCTADLLEVCDGFVAIELAFYPDGRTVRGLADPEQIERVRGIIGGKR